MTVLAARLLHLPCYRSLNAAIRHRVSLPSNTPSGLAMRARGHQRKPLRSRESLIDGVHAQRQTPVYAPVGVY